MNQWEHLTARRLHELARGDCVAVLPIGAIEQHGAHLPTGTDTTCATRLVTDAVGALKDPERAVILPSFAYGYSHDHHGFPGTISLPHRVMEDVIVAIATDVLATGFRRLLLVNGHGSNDRLMYYALRTVRDRSTVDHLAVGVTYWKAAAAKLSELRMTQYGGMAHGGELETSLMLHYAPEQVHMNAAAAELPRSYTAWRGGDLLDGGVTIVPERFTDRTDSGVIGDPTTATPETGEAFARAIVDRLANLIEELPMWPLVSGRLEERT